MKEIFRNDNYAVVEKNDICGVVVLKTHSFAVNQKTKNWLFSKNEAMEFVKEVRDV